MRLQSHVMTESSTWTVTEGRTELRMDGEDCQAYFERAKATGKRYLGAHAAAEAVLTEVRPTGHEPLLPVAPSMAVGIGG